MNAVKCTYTLDEKDYLIQMLYFAGNSKLVKKGQTRSTYIVPFIYGMMALWFFLGKDYVLSVVFCIIALLWVLLYPAYHRKKLLRTYQHHVSEHYKNALNRLVNMDLQSNQISLSEPGSESQINLNEVEKIVEIPSYIIFHLRNTQRLFVPMYKLDNKEDFRVAVNEVIKINSIPYELISDWDWK